MIPYSDLAVELPDLCGFPFAPSGRTICGHFKPSGGHLTLHFPSISWTVPILSDGSDVPTEASIRPVYYGLTALLRALDFPEDGHVEFGRYAFLQKIGWVSRGKNASGGALWKPSGDHYSRLIMSLRVLSTPAFQHGDAGPFRIIDEFHLSDSESGPSFVVFNPNLVRRFRSRRAALVGIDLATVRNFDCDNTLSLYRLLRWMESRGTVALGLTEFIPGLGSVQARHLPSVARKLLQGSIEDLVRTGVLASAPTYEKCEGKWAVKYELRNQGAPEASRARRGDSENHDDKVRQLARILILTRSSFELWMPDDGRFRDDQLGEAIERWRASARGRVDLIVRENGRDPLVALEYLYRTKTPSNHDRALNNLGEVSTLLPGARLFIFADEEHWERVREQSRRLRADLCKVPNIFLVSPDLSAIDQELARGSTLVAALQALGEGL